MIHVNEIKIVHNACFILLVSAAQSVSNCTPENNQAKDVSLGQTKQLPL